jgi:putative spermidine/putrescine transport system ATP-binding protein
MSFVDIRQISKNYGPNTVVRNLDLEIEKGEFISLLGPSGCGKTTVLRMIAGFEKPNAGHITVDGEDVTHLNPAQRNVGMVFQAYALFPNMTIAENVAFGLKVAGKSVSEIKSRVAEMLELVKLPQLGDRYPYQLSGGQQQRIALARALAISPRILLLDEPLSALDAKIRVSLREEIRSVQRKLGITTVFVTHDQEEALSMSDRVVVMSEGRIEQLGTPLEIYNQPKTRFVASFVGTLTILFAKILDPKNGLLSIDNQSVATTSTLTGATGQDISVALRPEAVALGKGRASVNRLQAHVTDVNFLGSIVRVKMRLGTQDISLDMFNQVSNKPPIAGSPVTITFEPADLVVLDH